MSDQPETQTQPTCFAEGLEEIFLRNRPECKNIWIEVLGEIESGSLLGIRGKSGSGKSMFLMQIMARALMGETQMDVLLVDAERTFKIFHFVDQLCSDQFGTSDDTVAHQNQIRNQLEKLHIVFPTESNFDQTIASLDAILSNNPRISIALIDSIGIFFFSECQRIKDGKHSIILKTYLEKFKHLAKKYKVTFVITLPDYIEETFECRNNMTTISLVKFTTGNFLMTLKSKKQMKEFLFTIDSRGIKFLNENQDILSPNLS